MGSLKKTDWTETLEAHLMPSSSHPSLSLSVIIPVYNCSESIDQTLSSLKRQRCEHLEVIIIDAGSTDHTLEIINSYQDLITRVCSVNTDALVEMLNKGISLSTGRYLTFLFPGSFYLTNDAYERFLQTAFQGEFPQLLLAGSIQRELNREPKVIYRPFEQGVLERGALPANLVACWIRRDLFEAYGKFNPAYTLRFWYEYCARLMHQKPEKVVLIDRVLVEFDYGKFTYGKAWIVIKETCRVVLTHFGWKRMLAWGWSLNYRAVLKAVWRALKKRHFS